MKLGKIERAIIQHVAKIHGNSQDGIPDFGPGTDKAIDRLREKGLLGGYNSWELTEEGWAAYREIGRDDGTA